MKFFWPTICSMMPLIICAEILSTSARVSRNKRHLVFPTPNTPAGTRVEFIAGLGLPMEGSTIIGYVVKFNYNLPYNASDLTQPYVRYERSINNDWSSSEENIVAENEGSSLKSISRWEIYQMIESSLGGSGRHCLLRIICEAAAVRFSKIQGLSARIFHLLFTPSATPEAYADLTNQEYRAAEVQGQKDPGSCAYLFSDCSENLLDYFTEIS